jgi:hypothetical protein
MKASYEGGSRGSEPVETALSGRGGLRTGDQNRRMMSPRVSRISRQAVRRLLAPHLLAAVAALALGALALDVSPMSARASIEKTLNPCSFVSNDDVTHLLGWTVTGRERRPYDLHGGTGAMCFIASSQGQVIVIVPDPGNDYPGISVDNDPNAAGLAKHVAGLGGEVTLYNGTVYVVKHHRNVAVRVVPDNHMASYDEIEGFAKVIIRHLH